MASSSRTIPQTAWEAQKETILHLRFTEGLPLSNNKNGGMTVMQVMREDHQFDATKSQYEQQLKGWGAAKHMKQCDWKSILPIYNRLKQQGLSPRIRLGETVLDEGRVVKAQRRYFRQSEQMPSASISPRMSFARNKLLKLDIRQHSGEYVEYSELNATSNAQEITNLTTPIHVTTTSPNCQDQTIQDGQALALGSRFNLATLVPESDIPNNPRPPEGCQLSVEHLECSEFDEMFNAGATLSLTGPVQSTSINPDLQGQMLQDDPTLALGSPFGFATLNPGVDVFRPNMSPLEIDCGDEQQWSANDPGSLLETFVLASPTRSVTHVNERTRSPDLTTPRRLLFKPYIDSMLDRIIPDIEQTGNKLGNVTAQMIAIRLERLLVEHSSQASGSISDLTSLRSHGVSQLPRIITSCFVNNLAGLDKFPLCLLFGLIKADVNVRESLLAGLRSNDVAFATALADCALRSAIRAGDEDIVAIILETTKRNINKIDLNSTVHHFKGRHCSPLGLAARMCHLGLVRKLLNIGAKVEIGALKAVIGGWRSFKDETEKKNARNHIITIFLANGASADCTTLEHVLRYGLATDSALELLIRAVFRQSHWLLLTIKIDSYLATLIKENAWAQTLFLDLLETCQSMGCLDRCQSTYFDAFDGILISVITNGNFELASSLLDHVQPKVGSLVAAIRTENAKILEAFLSKRIDMNDCARCFENLAFHYRGCNCGRCFGNPISLMRKYNRSCHCAPLIDDMGGWCRPTTPYSEAILQRNQDLISTLEKYGALDRVRDGTQGHLAAALVAAVRVRDVRHLESLLRLAGTCKSNFDLESVTAEAICVGHVEMFDKILFISRTHEHYFVMFRHQAINHLLLAMKRRAYEMVFLLLEYGERFGSGDRVVLEAVRWGDKEVIEYLHDWKLFTPDNLRPCKSDDGKEPASALCEAMAARNAELVNRMLDWGADPSEHIPLAVAIGDENMVRFLLDQGGKPSGVEQAISNRQHSLLELLLDRGVAPVGLAQTIRSGQHDMVRLLLRHGADPADDDAFCAALLCDDETFLSTLSNAFSSRYPTGKRGFGSKVLKTALLCCSTSVFKQLLILNLDVNSYNDPGSSENSSLNILQTAITQPTDGHAHLNHFHKCNPGGCKYSSVRRTDSEWEDIIMLLLEAGAGPENVSEGSTALLRAIKTGRIQTVKLLLNRGTNVNRPAGRGVRRTPLQQACEEGDFEIIKLLLGKGADVNALPAMNGGATALQLAAIKGSLRILRVLLDEGADIHGPKATFNGRTTLEGAAEHGRLSILNILLTERARGFSVDEIESAKALAEDEGHQGCVKRLELELYRLHGNNQALLSLHP